MRDEEAKMDEEDQNLVGDWKHRSAVSSVQSIVSWLGPSLISATRCCTGRELWSFLKAGGLSVKLKRFTQASRFQRFLDLLLTPKSILLQHLQKASLTACGPFTSLLFEFMFSIIFLLPYNSQHSVLEHWFLPVTFTALVLWVDLALGADQKLKEDFE